MTLFGPNTYTVLKNPVDYQLVVNAHVRLNLVKIGMLWFELLQ